MWVRNARSPPAGWFACGCRGCERVCARAGGLNPMRPNAASARRSRDRDRPLVEGRTAPSGCGPHPESVERQHESAEKPRSTLRIVAHVFDVVENEGDNEPPALRLRIGGGHGVAATATPRSVKSCARISGESDDDRPANPESSPIPPLENGDLRDWATSAWCPFHSLPEVELRRTPQGKKPPRRNYATVTSTELARQSIPRRAFAIVGSK